MNRELKSVYKVASIAINIMDSSSNPNVQKAEELKLRANDAFKGMICILLPLVSVGTR